MRLFVSFSNTTFSSLNTHVVEWSSCPSWYAYANRRSSTADSNWKMLSASLSESSA